MVSKRRVPPDDDRLPSLDEAERVVTFVLHDEAKAIADRVASGAPVADSLGDLLALAIAVVGATEQLHAALCRQHPENWESLERSAATFVDEYVVKVLAEDDPELKRAVTTQRRRKVTSRAGQLRLVESDRSKRSRWAVVTLPADAPIPIDPEVGERLPERMQAVEERLYDHLAAVPSQAPLVLAGQIVGLLAACECLLAQLPSGKVAAFCVQLGKMSAASGD